MSRRWSSACEWMRKRRPSWRTARLPASRPAGKNQRSTSPPEPFSGLGGVKPPRKWGNGPRPLPAKPQPKRATAFRQTLSYGTTPSGTRARFPAEFAATSAADQRPGGRRRVVEPERPRRPSQSVLCRPLRTRRTRRSSHGVPGSVACQVRRRPPAEAVTSGAVVSQATVIGGRVTEPLFPARSTALRVGWYDPGRSGPGDQASVCEPCESQALVARPPAATVTRERFESQKRIGAASL